MCEPHVAPLLENVVTKILIGPALLCTSRAAGKNAQNAFSSKFYPGGRNHQAQRLSMMNGISRSGRLLQRRNSTSHLGAKIGPIIYANRQIQPLER